jgi:hypothetical protein
MRQGGSSQFNSGVVILEETDLPMDPDSFIAAAVAAGATTPDNDPDARDGDVLYVVQFPGRPIEVYTENALRGSLRV